MRVIVLFVMFVGVCATPVQAQWKNVKLDEKSGVAFTGEPAIAINPKRPNQVVAALTSGQAFYSHDGGETWTQNPLETAHGMYGKPALVADAKGNFYLFSVADPSRFKDDGGDENNRDSLIRWLTSDDGGITWSADEPVPVTSRTARWHRPVIDAKGSLYLTWTRFDRYGDNDPNCQSHVMFTMSKNGKKWTPPVEISQTPGHCVDDGYTAAGAAPAVTFDGKVFVAWSNQERIFLDRSFDGGAMWLRNDLAVADQPGGWALTVPGHRHTNGLPILTTDQSKSRYRGSLYMVWADQRNGTDDADIWFTRSVNYGDNWTPPIKINDDASRRQQYLPSITVDAATGVIYILYYDRRDYDDHRTDLWLAWSTNGGASFRNARISDTPFVPDESASIGDYNDIAAYGGTIIPIWTRADSTTTSVWTAIIKHEELEKANK